MKKNSSLLLALLVTVAMNAQSTDHVDGPLTLILILQVEPLLQTETLLKLILLKFGSLKLIYWIT
ncbi:MAG: hypothetical protein ACI825_001447 [Planctomycetota bacterium]|jgi:hypothetical protein